jgi:uncharacterized protein YjbI with pentapeptide repeats
MSEVIKIGNSIGNELRKSMQADCRNCFGLCCTALNIVASSDFAIHKPAGTPCPNLQSNFSCQIHRELRNKGFKGCTVYDCLGAGQWVSQSTFRGQDWRNNSEIANKMFRIFPIMEQLYEMIAYVAEAMSYAISQRLYDKLHEQLENLQHLTKLDVEALLAIDIPHIRLPVNDLLIKTSELIRNELVVNTFGKQNGRKTKYRGANWMGKNLKGKDLRATDLRGALLIATNLQHADLRGVDFIGADLRDANVCGANLSTAMFLTQMQINSAVGNHETKLPFYLTMPTHWHNSIQK